MRAWVIDAARMLGLKVDGLVADRIAEGCGHHRGLIRQELAKYALYAEASVQRPADLTHDLVDAVGADASEADFSRLGDCLAEGDLAGLDGELARFRSEGRAGVSMLRAAATRMSLIARLRHEVDCGVSAESAVGRGRIWGVDTGRLAGQIRRWPAADASRAVRRLVDAQLAIIRTDGSPEVVAEAELVRLGRRSARLR
jgi:DNA polymerase-3 subunit delta